MSTLIPLLLVLAVILLIVAGWHVLHHYFKPSNDMKQEAVRYAQSLHAIELSQAWVKLEATQNKALTTGVNAQSSVTEDIVKASVHKEGIIEYQPVPSTRRLSRDETEAIANYKRVARQRGMPDPFPQFEDDGWRSAG